MKTRSLKIGIKGAGKEAATVPLNIAENIDDITQLSRGDIGVITRCFNRGWAIENQERSGARDTYREMKEQGKSAEEILTACTDKVANYDPTAVIPRTGNTGPRVKNVSVKAGKGGKIDMNAFLEQLKAQGVNVSIAEEGAES